MSDAELKTAEREDPPSESAIRAAGEVVTAFMKALKGYRLYLPNNQVLKGFVSSFVDGLFAFLEEHGDLCLRVTQFEIATEGTPVYQNEAKEESLAFRLFIHGVREVTFHQGVPREELTSFLQVIQRSFDARTSVDDLLTLLWEKELQYVSFIILDDIFDEGEQAEFDDFVEGGASAPRGENPAPAMKLSMGPVLNRLLEKTGGGDLGELPVVAELTREESNRLNSWIEEERSRNLVQDLCSVVFDILADEDGESDVPEILTAIDRLLDSLIAEGRILDALEVFQDLRRLGKRLKPGAVRKKLEDCLGRVGGERVVRAVEPFLMDLSHDEKRALVEFLGTLDESAVSPVIDLLPSSETREVATQVLKMLAAEHKDQILAGLADPRPPVVGALVRLLGEIGDVTDLTALRAPLSHEELSVRLETLRTVEKLGTPAAVPILLEVIDARNQEMRIMAIRVLSTLPPSCTRNCLFDLARSREVQKRSLFERREIFSALGLVRDLEVEDWLVRTLRKKGLFRREDRDEMRACAALALGRNGSERAMEALAACVKDRSPQVRRAVAQALRPVPAEENDGED